MERACSAVQIRSLIMHDTSELKINLIIILVDASQHKNTFTCFSCIASLFTFYVPFSPVSLKAESSPEGEAEGFCRSSLILLLSTQQQPYISAYSIMKCS